MTLPPNYPQPSTSPRGATKLPGALLMVVGAVYLACGLFALLANVLGASMAGRSILDSGSYSEAQLFYGIIGGAFMLVLGTPVLLGGLSMKKMRRYGLAMTGAICAMLPCSCCFLVGLPIGIWALVVLLRPEVKAAFR